jgi:predicted ATPase
MDCTAWVRFLRRELQPSRELSEELNAYVDEHELPHWKAHALQVHGWAIAGQGDLERGIADMEQGLDLFTALGNRLMLTVCCAQLAAAKAQGR